MDTLCSLILILCNQNETSNTTTLVNGLFDGYTAEKLIFVSVGRG